MGLVVGVKTSNSAYLVDPIYCAENAGNDLNKRRICPSCSHSQFDLRPSNMGDVDDQGPDFVFKSAYH